MQTAEEIKSAISNIRYYCNEVKKKCREQMDYDLEHLDCGDEKTTDRVNSLALIAGDMTHIEIWSDNAESMLAWAESLRIPNKPIEASQEELTEANL